MVGHFCFWSPCLALVVLRREKSMWLGWLGRTTTALSLPLDSAPPPHPEEPEAHHCDQFPEPAPRGASSQPPMLGVPGSPLLPALGPMFPGVSGNRASGLSFLDSAR